MRHLKKPLDHCEAVLKQILDLINNLPKVIEIKANHQTHKNNDCRGINYLSQKHYFLQVTSGANNGQQ
jgi:hypothetical protein